MSIIYCPQCKSVLPDTAHFCAMCGKSIPPAGNQSFSNRDQEETLPGMQSRAQDRGATLTTPLFYDQWQPYPFNKAGNIAEDDPASHLTWHKVVEHQRPHLPVMYPPRPARPSWLMSLYSRTLRHPRLFFWISLLAVVTLLLGGVFGILTSLGRVRNSGDNAISLQVTPGSAVAGATITLHGTHFTPRGRIGISRDASIPITDTGDRVTFDADTNGNFTNTVIVGEDWGNGPHNINAEDAHTHTIASFSILVLGQNSALRPAHLSISQNTLDLGSGDSALNSARVITLTNSGGGQLSWQSQSSQPWLQLTPQRGQATHGLSSQVTIAANRIDMHPGVYKGQLLFTSEAGDVPLDVQMQVTPLDPANSAMLQLSPAVLSFTGSDGEASLAPQEMKVSNPGVLPLNWTATTDVPWLSVAEKSGMIQPGSSAQVGVFVNIASLLPGTYRGTITFNGQGNAVKDSPQNVYVSVTIEPRCALQLSPNILTFSGAFQQGEPAAKKISITGTRECSAPLNWNASSNASWLTLSTNHGTTPSSLSAGIDVAGLRPGTYNSSIAFHSAAGTQTLPVTLSLGQSDVPALSTSTSSLNFSALAGAGGSTSSQPITITNSGGGVLNWHVSPNTTMGGDWLKASPIAGTLPAGQSVTVDVSSTLLSGLSPGTYTGAITITGTDSTDRAIAGSPQTIPVQFTVKQLCGISVPPALNFTGSIGQTPAAQSITLKAVGACAHPLTWNAQSSTASGGSWLAITPDSGSVSPNQNATARVSVSSAGLAAGTYRGTITISAVDSVTHAPVSTPRKIEVTLNVQAACTLQAASPTNMSLSAEAGGGAVTRTFSIGVNGQCGSGITLQASASTITGSGWLSVSPQTAKVTPGGTTSFTVQARPGTLTAGSYAGKISIGAAGGALSGSPQQVNVSLAINAPPALDIAPNNLAINVDSGQSSSQPITIKNTGGMPVNWNAKLAGGAPSFVSLSPTSGNNVTAGGSTTLTVNVDAAGITGGSSFTTSIIINATSPTTNQPVTGSPATISVTINVAGPSEQATPSSAPRGARSPTPAPTPEATRRSTSSPTPTSTPE